MCCIDNYRNIAWSCYEPLHLKRSAPESFQALKLGWSAAPREDKAGVHWCLLFKHGSDRLVTGKDLVNLGANFYECSYFPKQFLKRAKPCRTMPLSCRHCTTPLAYCAGATNHQPWAGAWTSSGPHVAWPVVTSAMLRIFLFDWHLSHGHGVVAFERTPCGAKTDSFAGR